MAALPKLQNFDWHSNTASSGTRIICCTCRPKPTWSQDDALETTATSRKPGTQRAQSESFWPAPPEPKFSRRPMRSFSLAGVPRPPPLHGRNMPVTQFSSRSSPAARPRTTGSEPAWEELEGSHLSTALGAPLGVQVTEITFCSNCKAPMKRTWDRCPGCKTPATASLAPTLQVQLQGDLGYLLQVPGAMESPRGAGEAAPRGEMIARQHAVDGTGLPEELTRQRQLLGFRSTCTTCNAPVKPAWPRCPSCRTPLHKMGVL